MKNLLKNLLHKFMAWYLRRCAGAFHVYPYGEEGRYVAIMDERAYHDFQTLVRARGFPRWRCRTCGWASPVKLCQLTESCHNDMEALKVAYLSVE